MKITVLCENTANHAALGIEHGLSLFVETKQHRILFDMGQSDLFARNAKELGVDLSRVDLAILSHGHYDHGGGIPTFLGCNSTAPIYLHTDAFGRYYNGKEKYIGLDHSLRNHPRMIFTEGETSLGENITLYAGDLQIAPKGIDSFGLLEFDETDYRPDLFGHEQYLCIEQEQKKVLFTGCAHRGILNLVERFHPDVVIGGFHYKSIAMDEAGKKRLSEAAACLGQPGTVYYTCHCTGVEQYRYLKTKMERLHYLSVGDSLVL